MYYSSIENWNLKTVQSRCEEELKPIRTYGGCNEP